MLDSDGYRLNVGIVIASGTGDVLWAHRTRQGGWQFPQGGIQPGEAPEQAMYRELEEEVGLGSEHVDLLGVTRGWLRYRLPKKMIRYNSHPLCVGQKQKWYLLRMQSPDSTVCMTNSDSPEFDGWEWVSYWYPLGQVVAFKREVYRRAMKELAPRLLKKYVV